MKRGSGLGGVGAEKDDGAVSGEGEAVGEDVVEGGLPPARGAETVERPAEAFGADGGGGVEGEDGDLLVGEGLEGARAAEGAEAAVVGEHLDVGAGVLLGEGDEVGDVAQRVILAATRGTENLKVESGSTLHFQILGATGRREDHTLGNISYLVTFAEEYPGADIEMLTDHGRFCTFSGTRTFEAFPHQQVSIFTLDPATAVSSEGLRWPLDRFRPTRWWQATLNDVLADSFTLAADGPVILFRTYAPKS